MDGITKNAVFRRLCQRDCISVSLFSVSKSARKKVCERNPQALKTHTVLNIPLYAVHKAMIENNTIFGTPIYAVHEGTFEIQAFRVLGALFSAGRVNFSGSKKGNAALK